MEDLYDPEEKIMCPYNSSHYIRRCKMSFHLVKCKKNYPAQKMVCCDFNTTHMIPEPELRYHHQMCPDRKKIEHQIRETRPNKTTEKRFPLPNLQIETDENWDDFNVQSYDPKKYVETHDVLRHLDVESGAKRKNFRLSERQRLGGMTTQDNLPTSSQAEPLEAVSLPTHRKVTEVGDDKFDPSMFREKLKQESKKVFLQYKPSGTTKNN